ncbi:Uncharacterised protein [Shigella sonnei]|nr:Uncharacterised protein [Shigella sonnei]
MRATAPNFDAVVTQLACITKCVFNRQPLVAAGKHTCFHRVTPCVNPARCRAGRGINIPPDHRNSGVHPGCDLCK